MKRAVKYMVVVLLALTVLSSCGTIGAWNQLSVDQQERIVANGLQSELQTLFTTGEAYAAATPSFQNQWKTTVLPAISDANKALAAGIAQMAGGAINYGDLIVQIYPLVLDIETMLSNVGINLPKFSTVSKGYYLKHKK